MVLETINLEEVGKDEGLVTNEKVWEASDLDHSINMPHSFWLVLSLEMELLGTLCGYVSADQMWVEDSIHSTNLYLADIEAQGVYHFPECKEHVQAAAIQEKAAEISVKNLQHHLIELANSSTKHDEKLGIIVNSFATFQSSLQKSIQNFTKSVDMMEPSNLGIT